MNIRDSKFFVCSTCLGRGPGYDELTVTGVDEGSTIYFEDSGGAEHDISIEKWRTMAATGFLAPASKCPASTHNVWTVIDDIVALHSAVSDPFVKDHLETASEEVFHAVHEYAKNN